MRWFLIACGTAFAAMPGAALAQDWRFAGRSSTDDVYVDAGSVRRTGQRVRYWVEYRHRAVQTLSGGTRFDSSSAYVDADCDELSYTLLQQQASLGGRVAVSPYTPSDGTRYARPGTLVATEIQFACSLIEERAPAR